MLARDRSTGQKFAIKILEKRHIVKEKKVKYVQLEKDTLSRLKHPLIIRLHATFQDASSLYFVLDLAENGELLSWIRKLGSLSLECIRFYAGELIEAVSYIHSQDIIHRDLKPENILLDAHMHIKLVDFGTVKVLSSKDERARSFVGTAEYVCPELLAEKSVTKSSDLWSLGCIFYQMMANKPPFKGSNEYQTFQRVMKGELTIPDYFPADLSDLIRKILLLDPDQRLGADGNWDAYRNHVFFKGFDWKELWNQTPPTMAPYPAKVETPPMGSTTSATPTGAAPISPVSPLTAEEQSWQKYLFPNERLLCVSVLHKRKYPVPFSIPIPIPSFKVTVRTFLLTDMGRLLWINVETGQQVGELTLVPSKNGTNDDTPSPMGDVDRDPEFESDDASGGISFLLSNKSDKEFQIVTAKKTYYLMDPDGRAKEWVELLQRIRNNPPT